MRYFQDFAHEEVRRIRFETACEAIARYPEADGWEYDFMRCPGYFAFGEVPTMMMMAGAALVILSGVAIVLRERQLGRGRAAMRNLAQPK